MPNWTFLSWIVEGHTKWHTTMGTPNWEKSSFFNKKKSNNIRHFISWNDGQIHQMAHHLMLFFLNPPQTKHKQSYIWGTTTLKHVYEKKQDIRNNNNAKLDLCILDYGRAHHMAHHNGNTKLRKIILF